MKKSVFSCFLLTFFYMALLPAVIFAQDQYVFDNANQLNDAEIRALEKRIAAIKSAYNFTMVIATEESIGSADGKTYSEDFYKASGFDDETPGLLSLMANANGQWFITTFGKDGEDFYSADIDVREYIAGLLGTYPFIAYDAFIDDVEKYLNPNLVPAAQKEYVIDNANRLSEANRSALEKRLAAIKSIYNFNVVIMTEREKATAQPAYSYYRSAYYDAPGVALMWEVDSGWYIQTYGAGPMGGSAIIDQDALEDAFQEYAFLSTDPFRTYTAFIDDVEKYLVRAATKIYVNDGAHLMTDSHVSALNERIAAIKAQYDFDVVLVTEKSIHGWGAMGYADDFFDYRGGGFGNGENGGVLLLWVTDSRWAWFSGYGLTPLGGETVFNDFTIAASDRHIDKYLKADEGGADDIYGMYNRFLDDVEKYLSLAAQGRSYNILYEYLHIFLIILWAIALLISFIVVNVWKIGMNTALGSREAAAYIVPGSLKITNKNDTFLYSTVSKTVKSSSSSSGGGGRSGGSHRSSSGRSHSGGGGRH